MIIQKDIQIAFVQGYFEGDGTVSGIGGKQRIPKCSITSNSLKMLENIQMIFNGKVYKNKNNEYQLYWDGLKCIDFLGVLYSSPKFVLKRKFELYQKWSSWIPSLMGWGSHGSFPIFTWSKVKKEAQRPYKANPTDSGWDLTLLEKIKEVGDVEYYSTGIKICPDFGWYFDLVPRSSLSKTDYMLANSVGVIDRSYVGEIIVPLRRMNQNPKPLELPARYVQIIPRPIIHGSILEVDTLEDTLRGEGGFGSSGLS